MSDATSRPALLLCIVALAVPSNCQSAKTKAIEKFANRVTVSRPFLVNVHRKLHMPVGVPFRFPYVLALLKEVRGRACDAANARMPKMLPKLAVNQTKVQQPEQRTLEHHNSNQIVGRQQRPCIFIMITPLCKDTEQSWQILEPVLVLCAALSSNHTSLHSVQALPHHDAVSLAGHATEQTWKHCRAQLLRRTPTGTQHISNPGFEQIDLRNAASYLNKPDESTFKTIFRG